MEPKYTIIDKDVNLCDRFVEFMTEKGHPNPQALLQTLHPDAKVTKDQSVQQFLINRSLRHYLGTFDNDTMYERACLSDKVTPSDWFYYFEKAVLPCIMRHDCPQETA